MGDNLDNNWGRILTCEASTRHAARGLVDLATNDQRIDQKIRIMTKGEFKLQSLHLSGSEASDRAKQVILFGDEHAIRAVPIGSCVGGSPTPCEEETTTQLNVGANLCEILDHLDTRLHNKARNLAVPFPHYINEPDKKFEDDC